LFDVFDAVFAPYCLFLPLAALIAAAGCCTAWCSLLFAGVHKMQKVWPRLQRTP